VIRDSETQTLLEDAIHRFVRETLVPREAEVDETDQIPADVLAAMREIGMVTDTRGYGLLGAFDLAAGDAPGVRGFEVMRRSFEAGLVVRVAGDSVILSPPFICEKSDIDQIFAILRTVLATL